MRPLVFCAMMIVGSAARTVAADIASSAHPFVLLAEGLLPPPQQTIEDAREADGKKRRDHRGRDVR